MLKKIELQWDDVNSYESVFDKSIITRRISEIQEIISTFKSIEYTPEQKLQIEKENKLIGYLGDCHIMISYVFQTPNREIEKLYKDLYPDHNSNNKTTFLVANVEKSDLVNNIKDHILHEQHGFILDSTKERELLGSIPSDQIDNVLDQLELIKNDVDSIFKT